MNLSEKEIALIQRYCWNMASENEEAEVARRLQEDFSFAQEVQFQQDLLKAASFAEAGSIKELMREEEAIFQLSAEEKGKSANTLWIRYGALAASIAFLLGLFLWVLLTPPNENEKLFLAYYSPYKNLVVPVERNAPLEDPTKQAFLAYESQAYAEAAGKFSTLLSQKDEPIIRFYLANAQLGSGKLGDALENFRKLEELDNFKFGQAVQWYLCLTELGLGNREQSIERLTIILANPSHPNFLPAKELCQDLSC